jgi:hypothetical protein
MWHKNSYRFSPFFKSIKKILINKTLCNPPPPAPPSCVDHKYKKSLKSFARVQMGINKLANKSKSG